MLLQNSLFISWGRDEKSAGCGTALVPEGFSPAGRFEPSFRAQRGTEPQEFSASEAGQPAAHPTLSLRPKDSFPLALLACAKARVCELMRHSRSLSVPPMVAGGAPQVLEPARF